MAAGRKDRAVSLQDGQYTQLTFGACVLADTHWSRQRHPWEVMGSLRLSCHVTVRKKQSQEESMRRSSWLCVVSAVISSAFHMFLLIRALGTTPCSFVNFTGALTQDWKAQGGLGHYHSWGWAEEPGTLDKRVSGFGGQLCPKPQAGLGQDQASNSLGVGWG